VGLSFLQQIDTRLPALRHRIRLLRWLVPLTMIALVIAFEALIGHWLLAEYGRGWHMVAEVLFYGTAGPILAFILLALFERWLDERDTSDYQAQLMTQARADVQRSRALCDDAVQALFSAGALIQTLEAEATACGLHENAVPTAAAQDALNDIIANLRTHLQDEPAWTGNGG
jgi:lysylphosphatidylglycerol synthetase-like protein (DUF2156 family)